MIEKFPQHYSMTNPASVYDEEALTALELCARIARKLNEVIEGHNNLSNDQTELLKMVTNTLNSFASSLPQGIDSKVKEYIQRGAFDAAIDTYAGGLSAQLAEAIAGVTVDSEIIDARIDSDGVTHTTAGESIRNMTGRLSEMLLDITNYNCHPCNLTVYTSHVDKEGTITASAETACCGRLTVSEGAIYFIKAYYGFALPDAVVFDENMNFIKHYNLSEGVMTKNLYETPIVIPKGGKYLYVNWFAPYETASKNLSVKKVHGWRLNTESLEPFITNLLTPYDSLNPVYTQIPAEGSYENYVLSELANKEVEVQETTDEGGYNVSYALVNAGEHIRFTAKANFGNVYYALMGNDGVYKYEKATTDSALQTLDIDIVVPIGVIGVYVASCGDMPIVQKLTGYSNSNKVWSHLKWACVGDSLTEKNTRTEKNYHDFIAEKTGIKVQNLGVSGAGYEAEESVGTCMYQLAENIDEDVDVITVMAGINDNGQITSNLGEVGDESGDTLISKVWMFYETARYKNPAVKIGVISPPPIKSQIPRYTQCNLARFTAKLKEECEYYGIPFLDLFHCSGLRPEELTFRNKCYVNDTLGVHPSDEGHKIISSFVYKFLEALIGTY